MTAQQIRDAAFKNTNQYYETPIPLGFDELVSSFESGANLLKAQLEKKDHEIERMKILIKIADELITNPNAQEDWKNAKSTRVM
jgi:hypothetical protein